MIDPLSLTSQQISDYITRLTPRQMEIIEHIASGRTDKELSHLLSIHVQSVRRNVLNARKKIGAENRTQLVVVFVAWKYGVM